MIIDIKNINFDIHQSLNNENTSYIYCEANYKELLLIFKKLGLDFNIIFANTNTSYNQDSKGRSSGRSGSDIERILAFHAICKKDPLEYVVDWDDALEHALQVQKDWSDNNE